MIAAPDTSLRSLPECLTHCGWQGTDRLNSQFRLETPAGDAWLKRFPSASQSDWTAWMMESPHRPVPDPEHLLAANRELQGPWKFTTSIDGTPICRGDLPRDAFVTDDTFDLAKGRSWSPLECWAKTATALAQGNAPDPEYTKPGREQLTDWLKEAGYVASPDEDSVKVTVPLSGSFREITIHWQDGGMVHLWAEVGRLTDWPQASLTAAEDFLHEANRRLRLVRITELKEALVPVLETRLSVPGPGAWLQAALDALCTGVALVVQPLASLRDPGVADMLLAGKTAKSKEGGV